MRLTVVADGDKRVETAPLQIEKGKADLVYASEELTVTSDMIGSWTFEVLRGDEVLATGHFTVEAR